MSKIINHGVIERAPRPKDWWVGGVTDLIRGEMLRADGQWDMYIPTFEKQYGPTFDTEGCGSFANLNALEFLFPRLFSIKKNFSDRFTAKMSGTTPQGNDQYSIAESIRKIDGVVDEEAWPFLPSVKDWDTYYTDIPQEVKDEAKLIFNDYKFKYQYIPCDWDHIIEALKYSPLLVLLPGHFEVLYGYETGVKGKLWNTYGDGFSEVPWDTKFRLAVEWQITKIIPNTEPMIKLPKNGLVVVVDGHGERYMNVDGSKLYLDEQGALEMELMARNATPSDVDGISHANGYPVIHLKSADIVALGLPVFNLKNVKLN